MHYKFLTATSVEVEYISTVGDFYATVTLPDGVIPSRLIGKTYTEELSYYHESLHARIWNELVEEHDWREDDGYIHPPEVSHA